MQSAMNRLSAFVRRRRKLVAIGWLVLLLVSIPFASRQTENLTGGFTSAADLVRLCRDERATFETWSALLVDRLDEVLG